MRKASFIGFVIIIAYALSWPAMAAQLEYCANIGAYMDAENNAAACGPDLSSPSAGANLADTAVDGSVTTDTTGGTMYGCLWTGATPPTAAQVIAGSSPCVVAKTNASVSAGSVGFNDGNGNRFTGLTASTTYNAAYVHDTSTGRPILEVETTASFETLAGGGAGGADLTGLVYVVDSVSGSDSNDGLSVATAWKTLAKVANSVTAAGSDVCLMDDGEWNESLDLDWGGASDDLGMLYGCYVDTGDSNKLVLYDTGTGTGRGARPSVGHDTNDACIAASTCTAFTGGSYGTVANANDGQIDITKNYMGVQGIDISYTNAIGVRGKGTGTAGSLVGLVVMDNTFNWIGAGQAVLMQNGVRDVVVKDNALYEKSQCHIHGRLNGTLSAGYCASTNQGAWGAGFSFIRSVGMNALVEGNSCRNIFGECINFNQIVTRGISLRNTASGTHSNCSYGDRASQIFIDGNLCVGPNGDSGFYTTTPFGARTASNVESDTWDNEDVFVRNNIIVNSAAECIISTVFSTADGRSAEIFAYGNACLSAAGGFLANRNGGSKELYSNAFDNDDVGAAGRCTLSNGATAPTADYNIWSNGAPSVSGCTGANDGTGDLLLATAEVDWAAMDADNIPTIDDFRPGASSPVVGAGKPSLETDLTGVDAADFGTFILDYSDYLTTQTILDNFIEKKLYYDLEFTVRDATTPDAGPLEYAP